MRTVARVIRAAGAALLLLTLLAGAPVVFSAVAGDPRPTIGYFAANPWAPDATGQGLLVLLTCAGWLLWAGLLYSFAAELAALTGRIWWAIPGLGWQRTVMAGLLGAIIVTNTTYGFTASAQLHPAHPPAATSAESPATAQGMHPGLPGRAAPPSGIASAILDEPSGAHRAAAGSASFALHVVQPREHLLDLAERYYGTAGAYERIIAANTGITQPDGRCLQAGQTRIYPGWTLRIPSPVSTATPSGAGAAHSTAAAEQADPSDPAPGDGGLAAATPAETGQSGSGEPIGTIRLVSAEHGEFEVTVRRGDTLSAIAQAWLGDAGRWPEIYELNKGHHFPDAGGTLTDPDLIYPGWKLDLPADATPPPGATPTSPPTPPAPAPPAARPPVTAPAVPPAPEHPAPSAPGDTAPVTPPAPGSDGVVPPPTGAPGPAAPSPSAPPAQPSHSAEPRETQTPAAPGQGVQLPSGSWLDLGLASALVGIAALVWAHRRRRYKRGPLTTTIDVTDPDIAAMPAVIRQIRRHLPAAPLPASAPEDREEPAEAATGADAGLRAQPAGAAATAVPASTRGEPAGTGPGEAAGHAWPDGTKASDGTREMPSPGRPVTPGLSNPVMEAWPAAGLGLTGPGAHAAARGLLVAALTDGTEHGHHGSAAGGGAGDVHAQASVVITASTLATLLGTSVMDSPAHGRLHVTGSLADAIAYLQEQSLYRARLLHDNELSHLADLRQQDPLEEPAPPLVLMADSADLGEHDQTLTVMLLAQGRRLDIHGLLLGAWPPGDTVDVDLDGTLHPAGVAARHRVQVSRLGRLAVLDETETVDLLRVLAEARTGQPPVPPRERTQAAGGVVELARPTAAAAAQTTQETQRTQDARDPRDDAEAPVAPAPAEAVTPPPAVAARVRIRLLGAVEIDGMRAPAEDRWRPQCLEVLAYLSVCGGSATRDALLEDLLPDKTFAAAPQHLYNYVSLLRKVLNLTGGDATYLTSVKKRYTLTRDLLDVDVWRMADALTAANEATSDEDRETALRAAAGAYSGPFAAGQPFEWAEPYRAEIDRKYLNAVTMLAELLVDDQPAEALRLLETAIGHHRHAEPLYALAMHAHAALGRPAGITAVRNDLVAALAELDSEPEPQTLALYQRLTTRTGRRRGTVGTTDP